MQAGRVLFLGIALLAASPAHAWTTWQGDAGRSGVVDVGPGPFDVIQRFDLHDGNLSTAALPGASHAVTPEGVVMVANRDGQCVLLRWDDLLGGADEKSLGGCWNGSLQGYAAAQELMAICTVGGSDDAIFQLRDARGQLRFRVVPDDVLGLVNDQADATWSCQGAALDVEQDRFILPMAATTGHEVLRFALLEVSLELGDASLLYPANNDPVYGAPGVGVVSDGDPQVAEFWPRLATVAEDGFVVTGLQRVDAGARPALMWLAGGSLQGAVAEASIVVAGGNNPLGSLAATALGPLAAARIGGEVLVVDPAGELVRREPLPFDESSGSTIDTGLPSPVAFEDLLIVPMRNGLVALSAVGLQEQWRWEGLGRDELVGNVLATAEGDLFAIAYQDADEGVTWHAKATLARLDARTGKLLQFLPLPLLEPTTAPADFGFSCEGTTLQGQDLAPFCPGGEGVFRILPTADGLVIATSRGDAVRLGPARDDVTIIEHTHPYPSRSESVSITVPLDGEAAVREVVVVWGDGAVESQEPPEATPGLFRQVEKTTRLEFAHAYGEEGDMRVAATTVFQDGTTATESFVFHVGKTPPRELNFIQRQFEWEHQDRTYGVLGLAVALLGGMYAFVFRKRRHRRIRRHMQMLDAIHERSLTDPEGALKELDAHQRHIRSMLMSGRIDDGEFRVLADRAAGISKRLHRRLLGPLSQKLSPAYRGQIETAFEDGLLTPVEARQLVEAMGQEKGLGEAERVRLAELLTGWATDSTG